MERRKCLAGGEKFYWDNTDKTLRTYSIHARDVAYDVPKDFAVYDDELFVQYDAGRQLLSFKKGSEDAPDLRIFDALKDQIQAGTKEPFHEVLRPA